MCSCSFPFRVRARVGTSHTPMACGQQMSLSAPGKALLVHAPSLDPHLHQAAEDEKLSLEIWAGLVSVKMLCTPKGQGHETYTTYPGSM